jgi:hypothetical protein
MNFLGGGSRQASAHTIPWRTWGGVFPRFAVVIAGATALVAACSDSPGRVTAPAAVAPPTETHRLVSLSPMPETNRFGVNMSFADKPPTGPAFLGLARDAGMGWVRVDFEWSTMQQSENAAIDTAAVGATIRNANAYGLNVFATITESPSWASGYTDSGHHPPSPAKYAAWQSFVHQIVTYFPPSRVKAWGVWNEPNTSYFNADTVVYDSVYHRAAVEIRAAGAKAAADVALGTTNATPWLAHVLNKNGSMVDVVSVHFYNTAANVISMGDGLAASVGQQLTSSWTWPIWMTEVNLGGAPSESDQATTLDAIYRHVPPGDSHWEKTFWYHMFSTDGGMHPLANSSNNSAAITDSTQIRKTPSYVAYRNIANPMTASIAGPNPLQRNTSEDYTAVMEGGAPYGAPSYTYAWRAWAASGELGTGSGPTFLVDAPSMSNVFWIKVTVTDSRGTVVTSERTITVTR